MLTELETYHDIQQKTLRKNRRLVKFAYFLCPTIFLFSSGLTVLVYLLAHTGRLLFDPVGVFNYRGHPLVDHYEAFMQVIMDNSTKIYVYEPPKSWTGSRKLENFIDSWGDYIQEIATNISLTEYEDVQNFLRDLIKNKGIEESKPQSPTKTLDAVYIFYRAENVFDPKVVEKVRVFEETLMSHEAYHNICRVCNDTSPDCLEGRCLRPISLVSGYGFKNFPVTVSSLRLACNFEIPNSLTGMTVDLDLFQQFMSARFLCSEGYVKAEYVVSIFEIGAPQNLKPSDEKKFIFSTHSSDTGFYSVSQRVAYEQKTDKVDILITGPSLAKMQLMNEVRRAALLVTGSLIIVFLWFSVSAKSIFLALSGLFGIFFSLVCSIVVWNLVFQQTYVGLLTVIILFLSVGIGADDMFIFLTNYRDERHRPLHEAFCVSFRKSATATFLTTSTTIVSFIIVGFSQFPSVSAFGFLTALVVLFNYVYVATMFSTALVIAEKLPNPWKCLWVFSQLSKRNLFLISLLIFVVLIIAASLLLSFDHPLPAGVFFLLPLIFIYGVYRKDRQETGKHSRMDQVSHFLDRYKIRFILFWALIFFIGSLVVGLKLRRLEVDEVYFTESALMGKIRLAQKAFTKKTEETIFFLFGFDDECLDRTGLDYQNPSHQYGLITMVENSEHTAGDIIYDNKLHDQLKDEKNQRELLHFCRSLQKSTNVSGVACFFAELKQYLESECFFDNLPKNFTCEFPPKDKIHEVLQHPGFHSSKRMRDSHVQGSKTLNVPTTGWRYEKDRLVFFWVSHFLQDEEIKFDEISAKQEKLSELKPFRVSINEILDLGKNVIFRNSIISLFVGIAISFIIVTIGSRNFFIGLFTSLSITLITAMIAFWMTCFGWQLGITEGISIIIVVGISVDYSVHLIHVYQHCPALTRYRKAEAAIRQCLGPLFSGLATSFQACFFLFFTDIMFSLKFGIFFAVSVTMSFICALTFLMPLLMYAGPVDESGDLTFLRFRWKRKYFQHSQEIFRSIEGNEMNKVAELLEWTPELLSTRDSRGYTPLHAAILCQNENIAIYLISQGAHLNSVNFYGETPRDLAVVKTSLEFRNWLNTRD